MEKEILIKVSRYVELSKKFQKKESEIFGENKTSGVYLNTNTGIFNIGSTLTINANHAIVINRREIYIDEAGVLKAKDKLPFTRAEKILAQAKLDAIVADEYDEYIKLQSNLDSYLKSLENLTK